RGSRRSSWSTSIWSGAGAILAAQSRRRRLKESRRRLPTIPSTRHGESVTFSILMSHSEIAQFGSTDPHEHLLDAVEVVAGLRRLLGIGEAVRETRRNELEADLLERLRRRRDLGDDIGALALLGQHRLDAAHLAFDAAEPAQEIGNR